MSLHIWHNGQFRDHQEALFLFDDRLRLGDGVFDTLLVVDGQPRFMAEHLLRLSHDAGVMGIACPENLQDHIDTMLETHKAIVSKGRYALNTLITRGKTERGLKTPEHEDIQLALRLTPVPNIFSPVHAHIARNVRRNEGSPLSQIKSVNYGDNILAMREAEYKGANEAFLLNNAGHITCATSGNLYARIDGQLYTPPLRDGVLNGVIRSVLIPALNIKEQTLSEADLISAENLYISNSIRGIVPVATLNGDALCVCPLTINETLF